MAYVRFNRGSDLYLFMSPSGLTCCGCRLLSIYAPLENDGLSFYAKSTQEMITHLASHRELGDMVPMGIEESLLNDDKNNYPT